MSIEVVCADWSAPPTVRAFTTTRKGGVSAPPYHSLNLGKHVGDDDLHVLENRRRLEVALDLPSEPCWLKQTHGIVVANLDEVNRRNSVIKADGAWTANSGIVVAVLTADCLPVVITNARGTEIAAIHAGWRGLAGGVLESAVARFGSDESLIAWLGPAIGPKAFEVGDEVRQAFQERYPNTDNAFVRLPATDKWLADLYNLATLALVESGVVQVTGGRHCTVSEPELFHSHRRDGVRSGRLATMAWLTG